MVKVWVGPTVPGLGALEKSQAEPRGPNEQNFE